MNLSMLELLKGDEWKLRCLRTLNCGWNWPGKIKRISLVSNSTKFAPLLGTSNYGNKFWTVEFLFIHDIVFMSSVHLFYFSFLFLFVEN